MSHETFSARLTSTEPCPSFFQQRNRRPKKWPLPPQLKLVCGSTTFSDRPAMAMTILKTEPGEYRPWIARLSSILNGLLVIVFHVSGVKRLE